METVEKPYVIGLDMGGTNSVFGIVDQRGTIKMQTAIETKAYPDIHDYVKASVDALQPAIDVVGGIDKIKGMGIGAPNGNYYTGNIEYAANLVWEGIVPITQLFEEALGIPVKVTNDASAPVWAAALSSTVTSSTAATVSPANWATSSSTAARKPGPAVAAAKAVLRPTAPPPV